DYTVVSWWEKRGKLYWIGTCGSVHAGAVLLEFQTGRKRGGEGCRDNWDVEEFVSKVCMGRFLTHPAFKITLAALIIGNVLIIASRTEMEVEEKYYGLFSAIDNVVLTVLTCEVLLNWYYGFQLYWKVFSVFGVTLFGNLVPMYFGNLGAALYSLFICLTQDGWINIYETFEEEGITMKIGGALYFFIFITGGAFICTNLLVAVVTSNLEQAMTCRDPDGFVAIVMFLQSDVGDDVSSPELNLVHLKAVMQDTPMTHRQMPLTYGNLGNLTEATCDDFCLILEGIQENLKRYKEIRDELRVGALDDHNGPF
uniref:Cation channel sperm associated 4 n=1 Tax=Gopherus evgoodei TaxID=1825980 RepID=A0A8C4VYX8_9SAUR